MIHIEIRKFVAQNYTGAKILKNFKLRNDYRVEQKKVECYLSIFTGSGHISNRKEFTIKIPNFNLRYNYGITIDFSFKKTNNIFKGVDNRFINFFKLPIEYHL